MNLILFLCRNHQNSYAWYYLRHYASNPQEHSPCWTISRQNRCATAAPANQINHNPIRLMSEVTRTVRWSVTIRSSQCWEWSWLRLVRTFSKLKCFLDDSSIFTLQVECFNRWSNVGWWHASGRTSKRLVERWRAFRTLPPKTCPSKPVTRTTPRVTSSMGTGTTRWSSICRREGASPCWRTNPAGSSTFWTNFPSWRRPWTRLGSCSKMIRFFFVGDFKTDRG